MDLIRVQRARLNLTQEDLAKLVGVAPSTIRRWEHGYDVPSSKLLVLANALDVNADELLNYEPPIKARQ